MKHWTCYCQLMFNNCCIHLKCECLWQERFACTFECKLRTSILLFIVFGCFPCWKLSCLWCYISVVWFRISLRDDVGSMLLFASGSLGGIQLPLFVGQWMNWSITWWLPKPQHFSLNKSSYLVIDSCSDKEC